MQEIFKSKEYAQANALFRWLSDSMFDEYYDRILNFLGRKPKTILDVGCGTGQFAINLAKNLPECKVFALDFSSEQINKMLEIAELQGVDNLTPVLCPFENYVPDLDFDVIICSEIIHLIDDLLGFSKKMTSMLATGGVIAIRTPSAAQIYERTYYNFFPTCRYIDLLRCKSKELIATAFQLQDSFYFESYIIDESKTIKTKDLIQGAKMKQYSTLHLISDQEFCDGLERMLVEYSGVETCINNFKMMLYLLKKGEK